ncbi:MAG TPA: hypothetical protein DCR24_04910 [Bacillus bacterium]|nr:hypothetical protein [Bacillus sp. (in: firmicutes)]
MPKIDYDYLLKEYREIWNNRRLLSDMSPEYILKEAVSRDLKDENSHPRARRKLLEKYYLATKRIVDSALSPEDKMLLIQIHIEQAESIQKNN